MNSLDSSMHKENNTKLKPLNPLMLWLKYYIGSEEYFAHSKNLVFDLHEKLQKFAE